MTKDEAIAILQTMEYGLSNQVGSAYCRKKYNAVKMAIKALEQEPCEESINRQDVLDAIGRVGLHKSDTKEVQAVAECLRAVEKLPFINPQKPQIEKVFKMRRPTPEERESVDKYVKSISKTTGGITDI